MIKKYKAEKNKKCVCGSQAIYKIVFSPGVNARQKNIYLCGSCREILVDIILPF